MGTGKTLTAISIVMSLPESTNCTVFVPSDVVQPWHDHVEKLGIGSSRLQIIPFEERKIPDLTNQTVIVDEAHVIITQLLQEKKDWDVISFITALKSASRVVFMTGTPITSGFRGISDLALLLNIGSNQEVVPIHKVEFEKKFFHVPDKEKQVLIGKLIPFLKSNPLASITMTGIISTVASMYMSTFLPGMDFANAYAVQAAMYIYGRALGLSTWKTRRELFVLDTKKLSSHLNNIVIPYRIIQSDPNYPKVSSITSTATYNEHQLKSLIALMDNIFDENAIKYFFDGNIDAVLETPKLVGNLEYEEFVYRSLAIGSMFTDAKTPPNKFLEIKKVIGKRTVIWSQFAQSTIAFEKFVKVFLPNRKVERIWKGMSVKKINNVLDKFKQQEIDILLLHPDMYHGISIHGATDMHMLEPCIDTLKYDQAKARVCRYHSHSHLPVHERRVKIINWHCTYQKQSVVKQILRWLTGNMLFRSNTNIAIKQHVDKYKPHLHHSVPDLYNDYFLNMSPDESISVITSLLDCTTESLREKLLASGSQCSKKQNKCCIWQPDPNIVNECVQKTSLPLCSGIPNTRSV